VALRQVYASHMAAFFSNTLTTIVTVIFSILYLVVTSILYLALMRRLFREDDAAETVTATFKKSAAQVGSFYGVAAITGIILFGLVITTVLISPTSPFLVVFPVLAGFFFILLSAYAQYAFVVEDKKNFDAVALSWHYVRSEPLSLAILFVSGLVLGLINVLVSIVISPLALIPYVSPIVSQAISLFIFTPLSLLIINNMYQAVKSLTPAPENNNQKNRMIVVYVFYVTISSLFWCLHGLYIKHIRHFTLSDTHV
jgi:hypothetical protein